MTIVELAAKHKQYVIDLRRDFHSYPELGRNEIRTSQKVAETLQSLGFEVQLNTESHSVIGMLRGGQPGKTVALRADMDALPLQEDTGLPFASRNPGVMHACGHDGHTAMALGAATVLSEIRDTLRGNVKFLFQPAEELAPEGGAKRMIEEGALEGGDAFSACMCGPAEGGQNRVQPRRADGLLRSFYREDSGKASHASQPQNGIDATLVASQLVCALQGIVSRRWILRMPP